MHLNTINMNKLPKLTTPITIRGHVVKNRVVVPPMAYFGATEPDGTVSEKLLAHYDAFAQGGAGLVITEALGVCHLRERRNTVWAYDDRYLPGLTELAGTGKKNGTVLLAQLIHPGLQAMPYNSVDEIPAKEFLDYQKCFADAALRCKRAGFDGAVLHAAHGYYLNQIAETSSRTDGYGGSLEGRMRLLTELVSEIRRECGDRFIISVRFGSRMIDELVEMAAMLEQAGADLLDVSTGLSDYTTDVPADFPYDSKVYAASRVKSRAGVPVICVGMIRDGDTAEQILEAGYADFTAIGRAHLCDPAWTNKTLSGGKPSPCFGCKPCRCFRALELCPGRKQNR